MAKGFLIRKIINTNIRQFSTSTVCCGKRNFRMFPLHNFRGSYFFRKKQQEDPDPDIPVYTYGVRKPGYEKDKKFHLVPEMIPELIVPDLTDCPLKPYVSYRASDIHQTEFTAKDLFDAIYSEKIHVDYADGKLDESGNPKEPNMYEKLSPEEAKTLARQTGSDMF